MNAYQPIIDVIPTYIAAGESYILFDHALYTPEELTLEVIGLAEAYGWVMNPEDAEQLRRYEDLLGLEHLEGEALDYLNTHHAPEGAWWGHDGYAGAFGCWLNTKDNA